MSRYLLLFITTLLWMVPFFFLLWRVNKKNLPEKELSKQFPIPIVATVYTVLAMILVQKLEQLIEYIAEQLPNWIHSLGNSDKLSNAMSKRVFEAEDSVRKAVEHLSNSFVLFIIVNFLLLLIFLIVKKIALAIVKRVVKRDGAGVHSVISEKFYEYSTSDNFWFLKDEFGQMKSFIRAAYWGTIVVSTLLVVICRCLSEAGKLKFTYYPVFVLIIIGELYFYIRGMLKAEYKDDVSGEADDVFRITNYATLRDFLRTVFPDKILAENTKVNRGIITYSTIKDDFLELEKSSDSKEVAFGKFFERVNSQGKQLDATYLHAALNLLNHKSIVFNNPFYKDYSPYVFYPANRTLLQDKKVLIILGRHGIEDDIKDWAVDGLTQINHLPSMWKVDVLDQEDKDVDVGIITRSNIHNLDLHSANNEFFENVGMCFIIEPSKVISTAQIGLNSIVKRCAMKDNKVTYCCFDKNCDGLVDSLSHILMTNIDIVSATDSVRGTTSYMCWDTDNELVQHRLIDNVVRYLGVGTELSFAGLKNQVSKVHWYGGEAFPVVDMKWIDRQYYYELCNYADIPAKQDMLDESFQTTDNYWSAEIENQSYLTVEDESYNMFEVMRNFATRTYDQGFINIITSNYLFKDYMANNFKLFEADPKAIPYIVSDYARTGRNVALRLLLLLSTGPVLEKVIENELSLIGIREYKNTTVREQLWNEIYCCFASASDVDLSIDYETRVRENVKKTIELEGVKNPLSIDLIKVKLKYNPETEKHEQVYTFDSEEVIRHLVKEMRNASYITEDEAHGKHFLGAELFGHIFQKLLPGQFFTFEGKYYEMNSISGNGDVMVRRASDHINGRLAYRQIRHYKLSNINQRQNMGSVKSINGFTIIQKDADIEVDTNAYYRMKSYDDFASAKRIEVSDIPKRNYKNKHVLEIKLPGAVSQKIKYTITVLLNESFRTFFAENQEYIVALTSREEGMDDYPLTYSIDIDSDENTDDTIYIVEDSQMDIGLIIAVERNIRRILETIFDSLVWHKEAVENSINPPPEKEEELPSIEELTPTEEEMKEQKEEQKKKKAIGGFIEKIKGIFKRKKKEEPSEEVEQEPVEKKPEEPKEETPEETAEEEKTEETSEESTEETVEEESVEETPEEETVEAEETPEEESVEETPEEETVEAEETVEEESVEETPEEETVEAEETPEKESTEETVKEESSEEKTEESEETEDSDEEDEPMQLFSIAYTPNKNKEESEETTEENVEETEETTEESEESVEEETSEEESSEKEPTEEEIPKEEPTEEETPKEEPTEEETSEEEPVDEESSEEAVTDEVIEEEPSEEGKKGFVKKPYHEHNFLLFGFEDYLDSMDIDGTIEYLEGLDLGENILEQARHGESVGDLTISDYKKDEDKRYCDFCGQEIYGVEYETLVDGRDRCMRCGKTAIKEQEEFVKLFEEVKRNMEAYFKIKFNVPIKVEMVNAQKLHKRLKQRFTPTPEQTPRILGVAINDKSGFSLLIENGSPRISATLTLAHELTHIWQYTHWNAKAIKAKYGKLELEVYEGMAKWVEAQYAYLINEPDIALRTEAETLMRKDEYGRGFLRYLQQYSLSKTTYITKVTPFKNVDTPLDID